MPLWLNFPAADDPLGSAVACPDEGGLLPVFNDGSTRLHSLRYAAGQTATARVGTDLRDAITNRADSMKRDCYIVRMASTIRIRPQWYSLNSPEPLSVNTELISPVAD